LLLNRGTRYHRLVFYPVYQILLFLLGIIYYISMLGYHAKVRMNKETRRTPGQRRLLPGSLHHGSARSAVRWLERSQVLSEVTNNTVLKPKTYRDLV
jgi:hypothetical protein